MNFLFSGSGWRQGSDFPKNNNGQYSSNNLHQKHQQHDRPPYWPASASDSRFIQQHLVHPVIDERKSTGNISVLVGKQVILNCVIRNLGNESVSDLAKREKNFFCQKAKLPLFDKESGLSGSCRFFAGFDLCFFLRI